MRYARYGGDGFGGPTHAELVAENRSNALLLARAENSGSEGCYVEVAKWNSHTARWERYAFQKFFGGEHPSDVDPMSCFTTAEKFADEINKAANPNGDYVSFIHGLPNYEEVTV